MRCLIHFNLSSVQIYHYSVGVTGEDCICFPSVTRIIVDAAC